MVTRIANKLNGLSIVQKVFLTVLGTVLSGGIISYFTWVSRGVDKAYSNTDRVGRLEDRAGKRDSDWQLLKTDRAVQHYYLKSIARKLGVDPPPGGYGDVRE